MISIYKDPKKQLLQNKQIEYIIKQHLDNIKLSNIDDFKDKDNNNNKDSNPAPYEKNTYKYEFVNFPFISYPIIIENLLNTFSKNYYDEDMYKELEKNVPKVFRNQYNNEGVKDYIKNLVELGEIETLKDIFHNKTYKVNDLDTNAKPSNIDLVSYKLNNGVNKIVFNEHIKESVYSYLSLTYNNHEEELANTNSKKWEFVEGGNGKNAIKLSFSFPDNINEKNEYYKCCFFLKNYDFIVKNNLIQSFLFIPNTDKSTVNKLLKILNTK